MTLSRRDVLIGATGAALFATAGGAVASAQLGRTGVNAVESGFGAPRYMAAAAMLGDGRVLVTGGFNRSFASGETVPALNSALIFSPKSGSFQAVAPMNVPRARHAAVALKDGRVAVIGGTSLVPTSSVEVYDPATDTWTASAPLAQPRFDHMAVCDGGAVYVLGGTSMNVVAGVETIFPGYAQIDR